MTTLNHVEGLEIQLKLIRAISRRISGHVSTRKTHGKTYPIMNGYSTMARRPMRDTLTWMRAMEDTVELIIEGLDKQRG